MKDHLNSEEYKSQKCCKPHGMRKHPGCRGRRFHKLIHLILFLTIIFFFPWSRLNWGTLNLGSQATISVTGTADGTQANQVATFNASVVAENTDKDTATQKVNTEMTDLINKLKEFGIEDKDLETQRVSTYETNLDDDDVVIMTFPPQKIKREKGWRASNTISIVLRNVDQASKLTDLLNESGATNISGPRFRVDDTDELEKELLQKALDDAQDKAEAMLKESGQKVGKIVRLSEGYDNNSYKYDLYASGDIAQEAGRGVSAPIEAGSQKITKTVTVVFEIR